MSKHYLIHLPHCGTDIPKNYLDDYILSKDELNDNIYQYADLYSDELFNTLFNSFGGVKSVYSRLFFDPERFGDDSVESMYKQYRLGWFYENAILSQKPLRTIKNKNSIRKYFEAHHKELNEKTAQNLKLYNRCTVIDCHSFSDERYWFHNKNLHLPDICIGFEKNHKDDAVIAIIKEEFKEYDIGINIPYEGSLVPTNYWGKDFRVKSVMIEINKRLYLEVDNVTKNENFYLIKEKLDNIYKALTRGALYDKVIKI
ncbi:MAG: N-formylglutamate amidohydrolase [Campylobacterota bacterium]|nr:N-formylglutamate amidohydrolase [Campylobacterota bacterium]